MKTKTITNKMRAQKCGFKYVKDWKEHSQKISAERTRKRVESSGKPLTKLERKQVKLEKILNGKFPKIYRMPSSTWAGGKMEINLTAFGKTRSEIETEWSGNGKWSGKSAYHTIRFSPVWQDLRKMEIDGMLHTSSKLIQTNGLTKIYAASWIEQAAGLSIREKSGYIAKRGKIAYHADSIEKALKGLKRKRKSLKKASLDTTINLHKEIGYEDAKNAGMCEAGILNFIEKFNLDKVKKYTGEYLLNISDNSHSSEIRTIAANM